MPELPDITVYIEALEARILDKPLEKIRITSPFLLRTFDPPISEAEGKQVTGLRRIGKQIVWELENELFLVFHLMNGGGVFFMVWGGGGGGAGGGVEA